MIQPRSFTYFVNGTCENLNGDIFRFSGVQTVPERVIDTEGAKNVFQSLIPSPNLTNKETTIISDFKLVSENMPVKVVEVYHVCVRGINHYREPLIDFDTIFRQDSTEPFDHTTLSRKALRAARIYNSEVIDVLITSLTHIRNEQAPEE